MATRTPARKAKPAAQKAGAKPAIPSAARPLPQPGMMGETHDACGCSSQTCCEGGGLGRLCACCPIAKIVFTRSFWAASVVAFLVIFATDWLLHTRFLMQDYAETSALWRAEGEIRHGLIFAAQALTAMAYAAIILGMGHAGRWWGAMASGKLAAAPVAISSLTAYIMLPFANPYIPAVWAVASLVQGMLVGLSICGALRLSRAPEASSCCDAHSCMH